LYTTHTQYEFQHLHGVPMYFVCFISRFPTVTRAHMPIRNTIYNINTGSVELPLCDRSLKPERRNLKVGVQLLDKGLSTVNEPLTPFKGIATKMYLNKIQHMLFIYIHVP